MAESTPDRIVVTCGCGAKLRMTVSGIGRKAQCPTCHERFRITEDGRADMLSAASDTAPPAEPAPSEDDRIRVRCHCGAVLAVPASAVGRKARCPRCDNKVAISSLPSVPSDAAPQGPIASTGSILDDFAEGESRAEGVESSVAAATCRQCGEPLLEESEGCIHCGHGMQTLGNLPETRAEKPSRGGGLAAAIAAGGVTSTMPVVKGTLFSLVGALIGAGIWTAVAMVTDYEIGWIAWGVGALAGFGMLVGCNGEHALGGAIAAFLGAGGILAGKLGIFWLVAFGQLATMQRDYDIQRLAVRDADVQAMSRGYSYDDARWEGLTNQFKTKYAGLSDEALATAISDLDEWEAAGRWEDVSYIRNYAVYAHIDGVLYERGSDQYTPEEWAAWHGRATQTVDAMTPGQQLDVAREAIAAETAYWEEMNGGAGNEITLPEGQWVSLFFKSMFGALDAVFITLAMITAWKIGAVGSECA